MTMKPIDGFDERYFVTPDGNVYTKYKRVMKLGDYNGYKRVELYTITETERCAKKYLVHRLIAQAFIPNPDGKAEVNHINHNRSDNRVENLEWVSHSENQQRMKPFQTATGEHHISFTKQGCYQGGFTKDGTKHTFHATTLEEAIERRDVLYQELYPSR